MNALISLHFPAHPFLRDRLTAVIGCRWQLCSTRDNEFQWGRREKRTSQSSLSAATYFLSFKGAFEMAASARQMTGNSFNPPIFFFFFSFLSFFRAASYIIHQLDGYCPFFSHTRQHCDTFSPLLLLLLFDSVPSWHSTSSSQHDTSPTSVTSPIVENRWERRSNQEQLIREKETDIFQESFPSLF